MLSDKEITKVLKDMKSSAPLKYFRGLKTKEDVVTRVKKIEKKTYAPFKTDIGIETKTSTWTKKFYKAYPGARSLENKAKVTGVPLDIIQQVYDKGLAAWRTGHRPGATPQQWGYARVHSFLMGGPTSRGPDRLLAIEAGLLNK
jgi:hypothetical protein